MARIKKIRVTINRADLTRPRVPVPPPGGPMKPNRGKGSYRRKPKHPKQSE